MRWAVEQVDVGQTRHLALLPMDDEAAAVDVWPTAPNVLCGTAWDVGRRCLDCVARWSGVQAYTTVVERRRAREEVAASDRS